MSKKSNAKKQSKQSTKKAAPAKAAAVAEAETPVSEPTPPATPDPRLPAPGTLLQKRDRHGAVRCECTVEEGGIRYGDQLYRSLSGAAMAAAKDLGLANKTQNGFAFWGITKPSRKLGDPLQSLAKIWGRYESQIETIMRSATDENRSQVKAAIWEHAQGLKSLLDRVAA